MPIYSFLMIFFLLICHLGSFAKYKKKTSLDSANIITQVEPDIGLSGHNTRIKKYGVGLGGVKAGIHWQKRYGAGIIYHFIGSRIGEKVIFDSTLYSTSFRFGNVSMYGEYRMTHDKKIDIWGGMRMGAGWINNRYKDDAKKETTRFLSYHFMTVEPYANLTYRIVPVVSISGGLGYRIAIFAPKGLSALTGTVGANFNLGKIILKDSFKLHH